MGKHLLLDCYGIGDLDRLNSLQDIYVFLASIPSLVSLDPLGFPLVVKATDESADGVTGFQLLTTSHASCHTWTTGDKAGQMQIDVFSCRDFDENVIACEVERLFNPGHMKKHVVRR